MELLPETEDLFGYHWLIPGNFQLNTLFSPFTILEDTIENSRVKSNKSAQSIQLKSVIVISETLEKIIVKNKTNIVFMIYKTIVSQRMP